MKSQFQPRAKQTHRTRWRESQPQCLFHRRLSPNRRLLVQQRQRMCLGELTRKHDGVRGRHPKMPLGESLQRRQANAIAAGLPGAHGQTRRCVVLINIDIIFVHMVLIDGRSPEERELPGNETLDATRSQCARDSAHPTEADENP